MKNEKETLVDSIFPKEDSAKIHSGKRATLKILGWTSPFVALLAMLLIMWGFGPIGITIGLLCGGSLTGIIITSVVMKKSGRDPSALLAIAAVNPLMILLGLCVFVGALIYFGRPEYLSVQKEYKKNNPGKAFPKDEFFGFVVGETSFDEAIEIFKAASAGYSIEHFENTDIKSLKSNEYKGSDIPLRHVALEFDKRGQIYSILVWMDSKKLSQADLFDVNRAFNYKYGKDKNSAFNPKKSQRYWTNSGVEIWVRPDERAPTIEITNLSKEREFENFRRTAQLNAAKKAANKFFPENSNSQEN